MLIAFLMVIALGLGLFGYIFSKELKNGVLEGSGSSDVPQKPLPSYQDSSINNSGAISGDPLKPAVLEPASSSTGGILGERYSKLEQLLEEKNRALFKVEQELSNEIAHRAEFERLQSILQSQIEELKSQNKKLKEDLSDARHQGSEDRSIVEPLRKPLEIPSASVKFEQFFDLKDLAGPSLPPQDQLKTNVNENI